jgi:hypothetical protein
VVDRSTGKLYIPFLHGGDANADYIKVLESDDGGQTFHFLSFNEPGVPDPTAFPVVTPGTLADCGTQRRLPGRPASRPRPRRRPPGPSQLPAGHRLITQPSMAAADGRLFIAYNASTSPVFGDPASHSEISCCSRRTAEAAGRRR